MKIQILFEKLSYRGPDAWFIVSAVPEGIMDTRRQVMKGAGRVCSEDDVLRLERGETLIYDAADLCLRVVEVDLP